MTFAAKWGLDPNDPDEVVFGDVKAASFDEARDALKVWLTPFLTDECPDCREQGTEAYNDILAASEWRGFVDGYDYWIQEAQ